MDLTYCTKCGKPIADDALYCPFCGAAARAAGGFQAPGGAVPADARSGIDALMRSQQA